MGLMNILIDGVNLRDYVQDKTIRIESSGSNIAATASLEVEDRLGQAPWIAIYEKQEIIIEDEATRLFGGHIAFLEDTHGGRFRNWRIRASDYTLRLEEIVVQSQSWVVNTPDDTIIAELFAAWLPEIDATTYVDNLRNDMPAMEFEAVNVREAMDHICRKTGGMYYVDFYRRLHYFSADEGVDAPFYLSTEPDMVNSFPYEEFKRNRDATKLINRVLVVGDEISVWRENAASIAFYGGDPDGVFEGILRDDNIKTIPDANAYGDWYVERHGWGTGEPECLTRRAGLRAGMRIRLVNSVWGIDQNYSVRRVVIECTGGVEPGDPQYRVRLQLGYRDAPGRRDVEPESPGPTPPPPVPPEPEPAGGWCLEDYVLTADLGVFYTDNFVDDPASPAGVPVWTAINTGLTLVGTDGLGFRGDPWEPENRQYCLMTDGLYRRVAGGNWVSILTAAQARALTGGTSAASGGFGLNGLDTSINRQAHVGVLFTAFDFGSGWKACYLRSFDYGATWTAYSISGWQVTGAGAGSLTIGAYQGSSPYTPGDVIYAAGRRSLQNVLWRSIDGGVTWSFTSIGTTIADTHVLVDPNDQSRVFAGFSNLGVPWRVMVSLDHGATVSDYDTYASGPLGYPNPWYHLSVGMDEKKTVRVGSPPDSRLHMTRDDGLSWDEPTPEYSANALGISIVQDAVDKLYLLRVLSSLVPVHMIYASEDEGRNMTPKAGANYDIGGTGGGDSIPYDCGGIRGILQIWTSPSRHPLAGAEHIGSLAYPQVAPLVGTGPETVASGEHGPEHEDGGGMEIDVGALSGVLADEQDAGWLKGRVISGAVPNDEDALTWNALAAQWEPAPGGGIAYEPLTNGDLINPELIFAGGDVVMVPM